ncbi:hypothetical protein PHLGIDRAFT_201281 [Phlebiopsis gigantea 11061_1 CR5-6]|uniref:F-box domain-containing protein n=1 Tax=Phlebiopsis gigantea (strain 11061_1 CR5-6) TaxID=745531 RepID=A0A0C3NHM1_PHLG1|nr:hypothetical protein PHLGIDRAFT_201281 [Phlebiopsis gigantea 11061_1 CR5-6]
MANGTVHLPQELTDHVIGFLADDATALSACTLVCRAWSVKSTLLLFKTLPIEWRQIHQFISSIHGLDRIREPVRKLHLGCCLCINAKECACERVIRQVCDSSSEDSTSYPSVDYLISMNDLLTVISLFPHLETATLYNLELSNVVATDPSRITLASTKLQLQELILVDIWDMAIYPALSYQLLNAFKSIGNLKVTSLRRKGGYQLAIFRSLDPALRSWTQCNCCTGGKTLHGWTLH